MTASLSFRGPVVLGLLALLLLVAGFGSWAGLARLQGAVILSGQIVVEGSRQIIEHPEGGIVAEVFVREGSPVVAGDPLLRLQDIELVSEARLVGARLVELSARAARLLAERNEAETLSFPDDLLARAAALESGGGEPADQTRLFDLRLALYRDGRQLLQQQIDQLQDQARGLQAEQSALRDELQLIEVELADQNSLFQRGLATEAPVLALGREAARLRRQIAALAVASAQTEGQIIETALRIATLRRERVEAASAELRDIEPRIAELEERLRVLTARVDRLLIRAPVAGRVLGLRVPKPLAVLQPGEEILSLVPQDDPLVILARLGPEDIDAVFPGQRADVVIAALASNTAPRLQGTVRTVAADTQADPDTGAVFYAVELVIDAGEAGRLAADKLVPGMRVEAFLATKARSPIAYLVEPFTDFFTHALRES